MKNSIKSNVAVMMSITIVVVGLLVGVGQYVLSVREAERVLYEEADRETALIAGTMSVPLWNFDTEALKLACTTLLASREAVGVQILDHKERVLLTRGEPERSTMAMYGSEKSPLRTPGFRCERKENPSSSRVS